VPPLAEAREQEELWFKKTSTWRELPRQSQNNLGTKNLVQRLEGILSDLMSARYATPLSSQGANVIDIIQVFPSLGPKSGI
jgi:hypothetical protein